MSEQHNDNINRREYREQDGSVEFGKDTAVDLHTSDPRLLSPEAARKLLLLQQANEAYSTNEKSRAQIVAEYAIACGVNLDSYRSAEQNLENAA